MPPRKNAEANMAAARNAHEPNQAQAQAQAIEEQAARLVRLEEEAHTLRKTIYWLVGIMVIAYAACLQRVGAGLSAVYHHHQQMMMMMAGTNQHHSLQQTITTTVEVVHNTMQDASSASPPSPLLPRPPPPRKEQTPIFQQCHIQHDISSPPDFLPTFYEYLGIDISKEPFASWILSTANLSDTTLSLIYHDRRSDHPKPSSSSSSSGGHQSPPSQCCPRLLGLHALEDHESHVGRALMEAVTSRGTVLQVWTELRGRCDLASCGGGGGGGSDDDDDDDAAGQGGRVTDALESPDDLLLRFITATTQQGQGQGKQDNLLHEDQHRSMALISRVYGNLADRTLARAYNRVFMGPLITDAAGEDGGGGDGGGGNECHALCLPQSPAARKAWLDRVCESHE